MSKVSYEDKIETLDKYIKAPISARCKPILVAIKSDVVRANTKSIRKPKPNPIYNKAMGVYRDFLRSNNTLLKMDGRKAKQYKEAMLNIIAYIRELAKSNAKPYDDESVIKGLVFIFEHWDRLNKFHRGRLGLPDIYNSIEEIIPQVRNGNSNKTAEKGTNRAAFGKL